MIAAVVLAAGTSSRFDGLVPKQLLTLEGRPLVQHAVDTAAAAGTEPVIVVVGHLAEKVRAALSLPAGGRIVVNPEYVSGQAGSLRAGLAAVPADVDAAVVLLADQPHVGPEVVRKVIEEFHRSGRPIVQAQYANGAGHPVLLGRSVWPLLDDLAGDVGARDVIAAHPELRATADVGGPAPQDVDTREDYDRLR